MSFKATLDQKMLKKFKPAKIFKHHKESVNSLDVSRDGKLLVTCGDDGHVNYYDLERAEKINTYTMGKEYNISNVKFSNHNKCILLSTYKNEKHSILYWSLHDNNVIAKFSGGDSSKILSLDVSPLNSIFVTVSSAEEARVWNYDTVDLMGVFKECQAA